MECMVTIPLYGNPNESDSAKDAILFLLTHAEHEASGDFRSYEVIVRYSDENKIECRFHERERAKAFIETHLKE